jgi:hypothetical protein
MLGMCPPNFAYFQGLEDKDLDIVVQIILHTLIMFFAFLENGKMRNMKIILVIAFRKYICKLRNFYFREKMKSLEGDV